MHSDVCLPRKIRMIQDMALGVNYLHTLTPPIIHRDIKLSNIFVGNGFEAKVSPTYRLRLALAVPLYGRHLRKWRTESSVVEHDSAHVYYRAHF